MNKKIFIILGLILISTFLIIYSIFIVKKKTHGPLKGVDQVQQNQEGFFTAKDAQTNASKESIINKRELTTQEKKIWAMVEKVLSSNPPAGYQPIPPGVRVLDVKVKNNKITINLSKELLSKGTGATMEDAIHQILSPISDVVSEIKDSEYNILVDGAPLEKYLDN